MPQLSVIVPVYNVERYLSECLDSILKQTFTDYEIVLVNDGSQDSSVSVCERYVDKDERIKLYHQKNQGLWSARNTGMKYASGDWIIFLDSDDYILTDTAYTEIFDRDLEGVDLIRFGCVERINAIPKGDDIFTQEEFFDGIIYNYFTLDTAWSCVFRREMLTQNDIKFRPVKLGEDTLFLYEAFFAMRKVAFIPKAYIYYRDNAESIMNTKFHSHFWETATLFLEYFKNTADRHGYKDPTYEDKILDSYYSGLLNEYRTGAKRTDLIKKFGQDFQIDKHLNWNKCMQLSKNNPRWIFVKLKMYSLFHYSHTIAGKLKNIIKK